MNRVVFVCETATNDNFSEVLYGMANPDIFDGQSDHEQVAHDHFVKYGMHEGRLQIRPASIGEIDAIRQEKLERVRGRLGVYESAILGVPVKVGTVADNRLPMDVTLSIQDYDPDLAELVDGRPNEMFLDLGAGLTQSYRANVVYADIALCPTTDVLCFGQRLPFDDATFDGAVCGSVLEHVREPWLAVHELIRVVRPGGTMIIDWPFLQPVHGYPDHYFNATAHGAASLFEEHCANVAVSVPEFLHPIFALRWMVWEWSRGLSDQDRDVFRTVKIGDLLDQTPTALLQHNWWAQRLDPTIISRIASGTRLTITR
jgi:SAM-dependent methyltransferase